MAADNPYFMPKKDIFEWLETDIGVQISNPSECCTGVVYLKILDKLFPGGKIPLRKIKMDAKLEWECRSNLKILQQVFQDLDIKRSLEIERLSTGKPADNLELLQWLKGYYDRMITGKSPEAQGSTSASFSSNASLAGAVSNFRTGTSGASATTSNRSSTSAATCGAGGSASRNQTATSSSGPNSTVRASPKGSRVGTGRVAGIQSKYSVDSRRAQGLMETIQQKDHLIKQLQSDLECVETESRFYFGKLRRLELMSLEPGRESFTVEEVQYVLFTEDDFAEEAGPLRTSSEPRTCEDTTTSSNHGPTTVTPTKPMIEVEPTDPTVAGVTSATQRLKISGEDAIGSPEAGARIMTTSTTNTEPQDTIANDSRPFAVDSVAM